MDGFDRETGEVVALPPAMPPVIAAAIVAVMKTVKQLGADERNDHGKYNFVSVDKFYERIGPALTNAGLMLLIDETHSEVKEGKSGNPWLFIEFALTFAHESGVMSGAMRRSVALPISGPQAYGAAQSYVEKQFMRQVFKIPTGDKDADDTAPSDGSAPNSARGGRAAQEGAGASRSYPPRQQAAPPPSDASADAKKRYNEIVAEIEASMTVADLDALAVCPTRVAAEAALDRAEPEARAAELKAGLQRRLDKRREMLIDAADRAVTLQEGEYR